MSSLRLCAVPGDGIGPEVCAAALEVLGAALPAAIALEVETGAAGARTFLETGTAFPDATRQACLEANAILHGAAGLPDVRLADGTEAGQDFSMRIRAGLDLYANIRPIKRLNGAPRRLARDAPIAFTIVRENTEGLYASRSGGTLLRDEVATDTLVLTRSGIERIVRTAADLARRGNGAPADGVKRVTVVDKANVLRSYAFFRRVADEVLEAYPDVTVEHVLIDAMTVHMIERPERFDVIVTENIFGDILSDLGAALVGGMGMAPSAELGAAHGYFQGSHGSAPDIAGKALANPIACILSAAMMLDWLAERHAETELAYAARRIEAAVASAIAAGLGTPDIGGTATTEAITRAIVDRLG